MEVFFFEEWSNKKSLINSEIRRSNKKKSNKHLKLEKYIDIFYNLYFSSPYCISEITIITQLSLGKGDVRQTFYFIFISLRNICCGCSLEVAH